MRLPLLLLLSSWLGHPALAEERPPPPEAPRAPDAYRVRFETTAGKFTVKVIRAWAPLGADRFLQLVDDGFYDDVPTYRVLRGLIVQWGLSLDPAENHRWMNARLPDDPVVQLNTRATVVFAHAGPDSRTTQVFVNLGANPSLDDMGFTPFGKVTAGMRTLKRMYSLYGDSVEQHRIRDEGEPYFDANWPRLDRIERATVIR